MTRELAAVHVSMEDLRRAIEERPSQDRVRAICVLAEAWVAVGEHLRAAIAALDAESRATTDARALSDIIRATVDAEHLVVTYRRASERYLGQLLVEESP